MFNVFQDFAIKVINTTHDFWKALITQKANAGELNWWVTALIMAKHTLALRTKEHWSLCTYVFLFLF